MNTGNANSVAEQINALSESGVIPRDSPSPHIQPDYQSAQAGIANGVRFGNVIAEKKPTRQNRYQGQGYKLQAHPASALVPQSRWDAPNSRGDVILHERRG